ncbi:uncharacterized protein LOC113464422, partial [Ceratina calcarata]|uniref:Uncharacterized protein LOC113464422 n=1 Tax=Ceratina calcarata TaxID=156304 RepID=A0AAJ7S1W9_9HYME
DTAATGESDIAKLTGVLSTIIKTGSGNANRYINEKVLPDFDPGKKVLSATEWLNRVDTYAFMYEWNDTHKLYLAQLKLQGTAKKWFDGLQYPPMTWEAFRVAIVRQFSGEESFGKLFELANNYTNSSDQNLLDYSFEKVKRLNKLNLDIPELKMVDFVVHGIQDDHIRMNLRTAKNRSLPELNQCLETLTIEKLKETKNPKETKDRRKYVGYDVLKNKNSQFLRDKCYRCGEKGHKQINCPKSEEHESESQKNSSGKGKENVAKTVNIKLLKCGYCKNLGHVEKDCFKRKNKEMRESEKGKNRDDKSA